MGARVFVFGGVAQLGEHLLCKQGVIGSNPFTSIFAICLRVPRKQMRSRSECKQKSPGRGAKQIGSALLTKQVRSRLRKTDVEAKRYDVFGCRCVSVRVARAVRVVDL